MSLVLTSLAEKLIIDWGISSSLIDLAVEVERKNEINPKTKKAPANFLRVLRAFGSAGVCENQLHESHGYGYYDLGREALEKCYAEAFGGEDALVRPQFVSGTHALRAALFGLLRPGDEVLVIPSIPYDSLHPVFGFRQASGSLEEWGVRAHRMNASDILEDRNGRFVKAKVAFIQRSKGYSWQESITISKLSLLIEKLKHRYPEIRVVVDNCYGEFVEEREPCEIGADLVAGSLLKNPGGGLCSTGGYIVGKASPVEQAASALTAPGLGKEVGPSLGLLRDFFRGLFLAPQFVDAALEAAEFGAALFKELGYRVLPEPGDERTDIIQAIELGSRESLLLFARGIQAAGPLDQRAVPVGVPMAGYADEVVMSGGTFVQGGSLELSCDAPLRPPYIVYVQGGLTALHGKLGYLLAAQALMYARKAEKESTKVHGIYCESQYNSFTHKFPASRNLIRSFRNS